MWTGVGTVRDMRITRAVPAAMLLLALAACGTPDATTPAEASAPTTPALAKCADVFKPGQVIDQKKAAAGCLDPDGGAQSPGSFRCGDGRHLWQVDAATGAPAGWGFSGSKYRASKDAARDPAYTKAYASCNG